MNQSDQAHPASEQINQSPAQQTSSRTLLVPVDDAEDCELALQWTIDNVFRDGDVFHFLHIIPPPQHFASAGPQPENLQVLQAHAFIQDRFVPKIDALQAQHQISIVNAAIDAASNSIGDHICIKADELSAALVVMAAHHKGRLQNYLLGSTTEHCINFCRSTVLVAH